MAVRVGHEYQLAVNRRAIDAPFTVAVHESFQASLTGWGSASRSSPLFALDDAAPPKLSGRSETLLCFLGPVHPEQVSSSLVRFLTYGMFNVVVFASTRTDKVALRGYLKHAAAPWELWTLKGSEVVGQRYSSKQLGDYPRVQSTGFALSTPKNQAALKEYLTLLAVTRSRCAPYIPDIDEELTKTHKVLMHQMEHLPIHSVRKLQWLVNVNAALSRFSSQTFAGTSPILGTECHLWTHSLLGIGIATKALLNLRRFVVAAGAVADLTGRLALLKSAPPAPNKLGGLSSNADFWTHAKLPDLPLARSSSVPDAHPSLIVYLSGRDGYKSTDFSLSAPLEVLHGANTYAWSLQTLTHELSHTFVDRILSQTFDSDLGSDAWESHAAALKTGARAPVSMFESVQQLLIEALVRLEWEQQGLAEGEDAKISKKGFGKLVEAHYGETSELLAHLFDYVYFYEQDPGAYIRSIWSSWDVIPNIESRVSRYIVRTLVATHFSNLSAPGGATTTIDRLIDELEELHRSTKDGQYIELAVKKLKAEKSEFRESLLNRVFLVKFAKVALYSPEAAKAFAHRASSSKRRRTLASATQRRVFPFNRRVVNPLTFLEDAPKHKEPDAATSLWMLTQLAFVKGSGGA